MKKSDAQRNLSERKMKKQPPEPYEFDEKGPPRLTIEFWRGSWRCNFRGWRLYWPDTPISGRKLPEFISRIGWVELGPLYITYECGRRAIHRKLLD